MFDVPSQMSVEKKFKPQLMFAHQLEELHLMARIPYFESKRPSFYFTNLMPLNTARTLVRSPG